MDFEISGLFRGTATDVTYLHMDYGAFLLYSEGEDYEEKDRWTGINFNWSNLCVNIGGQCPSFSLVAKMLQNCYNNR